MNPGGAAGMPQGVTLDEMRRRWGPVWCVWRSRNVAGELNGWCATRRGKGRELSMTVMAPTAGELEKALVQGPERWPVHG